MTDRELLELAAKAAGLVVLQMREYEDSSGWWAVVRGSDDDSAKDFDPFGDDGDALRLAVKLSINIEHMRTMGGKQFGVSCYPVGRGDCGANETDIEDYAAATRRAIVRAAAEIAKAGEPKCVVEKVNG